MLTKKNIAKLRNNNKQNIYIMSYIEDIQNAKNVVRNNIAKGFGCEFVKSQDDELGGVIEKAVYADTAQNRKLGRVGQEYHRGRGKKEDDNKSATPIYDIKELMKRDDAHGFPEITSKYGVKLANYTNGSLECRIEDKKGVKGLKNFLKDSGLKFDTDKLIRIKGVHGMHHYEYDLSDITGHKTPGLR